MSENNSTYISYVQWTLDLEDGIDPYDPLGTIKIVGDEGYIEDKCTYLDGYFEAIMLGVESLEKGKTIGIDPFIEPDEIIFNYTNDYLLLGYGKQQAKIINVKKFVTDVCQSIQDLLDVLDNAPVRKNEPRPNFEIFRQFIQNYD